MDYDYETASAMHSSGRYIYTVFSSHLALEKSLKAIYAYLKDDMPPRVHNLLVLLESLDLDLPDEMVGFLRTISDVSITARYPYKLSDAVVTFNEERSRLILDKTSEVLKWLKKRLEK
ncbi:MAG TPA: DNA-binding protein [Kosmotogaceae bacterium]|nr:DNA-binding protein [Kosmotogaceae bacterium]